mmetsp:Transcript_42056/g.89802  ORF Transcript_42056/g.89802 Transcript_42056/m.89802 type:complete len:209 (+) Transcript_42056:159-785(+)
MLAPRKLLVLDLPRYRSGLHHLKPLALGLLLCFGSLPLLLLSPPLLLPQLAQSERAVQVRQAAHAPLLTCWLHWRIRRQEAGGRRIKGQCTLLLELLRKREKGAHLGALGLHAATLHAVRCFCKVRCASCAFVSSRHRCRCGCCRWCRCRQSHYGASCGLLTVDKLGAVNYLWRENVAHDAHFLPRPHDVEGVAPRASNLRASCAQHP